MHIFKYGDIIWYHLICALMFAFIKWKIKNQHETYLEMSGLMSCHYCNGIKIQYTYYFVQVEIMYLKFVK